MPELPEHTAAENMPVARDPTAGPASQRAHRGDKVDAARTLLRIAPTLLLLCLPLGPTHVAEHSALQGRAPVPAAPPATSTARCAACHAAEVAAWASSDHAHALAPPGAWPEATPPWIDGALAPWTRIGRDRFVAVGGVARPLRWWIGRTPITQPVLELEPGHLAVLPLGWTGDHWTPLDTADAAPGTALHWTAPPFSFVDRCVECHATRVTRRLEPETGVHELSLAEPYVGCEACHGPSDAHLNERASMPSISEDPGSFRRAVRPTGVPARSTRALEQCGRCHARRERVAPMGAWPSAMLDSMILDAPLPPVYFPDGSQREEVFELGSFAQSAMFLAGVRCGDCHEPHTGRLRAEGDSLCTTCHDASLATAGHHSHNSGDVRCIDCHMPPRTYMALDVRRDHRFSVPRPDLAHLGALDPCADCHSDRDATWAAAHVRHGPRRELDRQARWTRAMSALEASDSTALPDLVAIVLDVAEPPIRRRGALEATARFSYAGDVTSCLAQRLHASTVDELRLAATVDPDASRILLRDRVRAVRVRAATTLLLAGVPLDERARRELRLAQEINAEQSHARVRLALLAESEGDLAGARMWLARAIDSGEPDDMAPALELAALFERHGQVDAATRLRASLPPVPEVEMDAVLAHVRAGAYVAALQRVRRARQRADHESLAWLEALLLDRAGERALAASALEPFAATTSSLALLRTLVMWQRAEGLIDTPASSRLSAIERSLDTALALCSRTAPLRDEPPEFVAE